jgi:hypothetical protein
MRRRRRRRGEEEVETKKSLTDKHVAKRFFVLSCFSLQNFRFNLMIPMDFF